MDWGGESKTSTVGQLDFCFDQFRHGKIVSDFAFKMRFLLNSGSNVLKEDKMSSPIITVIG